MATGSNDKQTEADLAHFQERISYLELLKSFHDEIVKIVRIYTSNEAFTSERCLQEIVNFIQRKLQLSLASIFLVDDISRELVLYVAAGEQKITRQVKKFRIPVGEGITGGCARSGESIWSNEVPPGDCFLEHADNESPSKMCIPIKSKHRIVGVLDLEETNLKRLGEDLRPLLEDLALNIGFVLENKKLYDDLKEYSEQLERKVEEKVQALRKSENRYRSIVENATDAIITTDLNGNLTWANRAFCELVEMGPGEWEEINISRIVKKGNLHRIFSSLKEVAEGAEVRPFPLTILTQSGDERIVEFACTGIREGGRISGLEATLRDVTEKMVVDKLRKNYLQKLEEEVIHRTAEIKDTQRASILAIANLAESIDDDTGGHIQRIQYYSKELADNLRNDSPYQDQITEEYAELIYDLSPLHDLGKVGIRDYILQKPDKLTSEEFETMKDHTEIGAHALRMAGAMIHRESIFSIAEMIARYHHEKWDGSGYPAVEVGNEKRPLRGEEIPLCARIVAVADVYDALTSKRPYKMPFPHERAKEMIVRDSGKHFDPVVVDAFLQCEEAFIEIRKRFPDTKMVEGKPFELPARDRV